MSCPTEKAEPVAAPRGNALTERLDGLRTLARETGAGNASLYVLARLLARLAPSVASLVASARAFVASAAADTSAALVAAGTG